MIKQIEYHLGINLRIHTTITSQIEDILYEYPRIQFIEKYFYRGMEGITEDPLSQGVIDYIKLDLRNWK